MYGYTQDLDIINQQIARYQGPDRPFIVNIEDLKVRIHGNEIVRIQETPHYQFATGNFMPYIEFLYRYDHKVAESLDSFCYIMYGPWDYLDGPHEQDFIRCDGSLVIMDGVHRATRLYHLGIKIIPVVEVIHGL